MKRDDSFDELVKGLLLNRNLKIGTTIAAGRILYNFITQLDLKKDSRLIKKEIAKQIKLQPISALTFSFVLGMTLARLLKRMR